MPYWLTSQVKQTEKLVAPFLCACGCHGGPMDARPKATHLVERRCDECYDDSGKPLIEVLESALDEWESIRA